MPIHINEITHIHETEEQTSTNTTHTLQLSVRKAALAAASRLVSAFPEEIACCELWVRAALPLVR